jgi:phenylalanyl-tRNA synthetase beta subunit
MPIPKYPPQVEDMTFVLPKQVKYAKLVETIQNVSSLIASIDLVDMYKGAYTARISYQDPEKTLTDADITPIRTAIVSRVKKELKGDVK